MFYVFSFSYIFIIFNFICVSFFKILEKRCKVCCRRVGRRCVESVGDGRFDGD